MLGQSIFTRRLLASQQSKLTKVAQRQFSLLVPLQAKAEVPAEVSNHPLTDEYFRELTQMHNEYNVDCQNQLKEMNENLITNIIQRGGNDGWEVQEDFSKMTKKFEFKSFEQAQAFVQHVSKVCNEKDHHPEWHLVDGGKSVEVMLTSHFADNKITRLDFEVAEAMNNSFYIVDRQFKMFPRFSEKQWSSLSIAFGSLVVGSFLYVYFCSHPHPQRYRYMQPIIIEPRQLFSVSTDGIKNEEQLEKYVVDNVDLYAYRKMQASQSNGVL